MEKINEELFEKAKQANSAEEILALAKENGMDMTEEQAKTAYANFHPVSGEIADDELENVAGGGCGDSIRNGDRVHVFHGCPKCNCHFGIMVCNPYFVGVQCEQCGESYPVSPSEQITKL